jgi:cell wall-associated NlpC family hydrolase
VSPGEPKNQAPFTNPAPIAKKGAPKHVPHPDPTAARRLHMVGWAHWGINNRGRFVYDEGSGRADMFNSKPGDLSRPVHADCSQFYAAICHWVGIPKVTDTDYTGTLLQKGRLISLANAKPGDCVIWGPGTGTHAAMLTERDGHDWWCVGFGHQGAPDRVLLSVLDDYFIRAGHPGVRFLDFAVL